MLLKSYPAGAGVTDDAGCLPLHHLAAGCLSSKVRGVDNPLEVLLALLNDYPVDAVPFPKGCKLEASQGFIGLLPSHLMWIILLAEDLIDEEQPYALKKGEKHSTLDVMTALLKAFPEAKKKKPKKKAKHTAKQDNEEAAAVQVPRVSILQGVQRRRGERRPAGAGSTLQPAPAPAGVGSEVGS